MNLHINGSYVATVESQPSLDYPPPEQQLKIAYLMSGFPKITETFILLEMLALEKQGVQVEVYPLIRERTEVIHPEARAYVERAHFVPFISGPIILANLYYLRRNPIEYFRTLYTVLRANLGSRIFFIKALAIIPKAVYIASWMEKQEINHIHAHFASHPAVAAFIIHRLTGLPFSFTAHGSDLHRSRRMLREKVAEAAFVVTISQYNKELILSECSGQFEDKLVVIHCGVDTNFFTPRHESGKHKPGDKPFRIICIGKLHEVKGQTYLIQACQFLVDNGVDFTCDFVGDGPDYVQLEKQVAEAGLSEKVRFLGQLTREEIRDLLRGADVLVAPSVPTKDGRREGIPVVLMEAMSSGVPVIASRLSGIPELVENGETGLLITSRDVPSLVAALENLYRDPDFRKRLGQAARQKIVEEFNLTESASDLLQQIRYSWEI